ncbi:MULTISPECIES: DUF397 domain-containing protein [Streptomyces]|uniref:DUF397 domain-containing protein n=1 Tax=Streptomyces TaxID=1883 RepID=UPI00163CA2EF|nr:MULTISPECIES: DUF397 domain-containing protein [Streptomyces]MBC2875047.1 DUF397 domain-containing protein [Streptomyces sp. TYQ1024]UBI37480.1 DUF397 domain-containing protein [Streptomyces mobaraensis]UKW30070.1 DUF397 domain-containing protein [Streptomyces sp. TYQ1024]
MPKLLWQKSSFSTSGGNGDCLEVASHGADALHLRESDDPGTVLTLAPAALRSLLALARNGRLETGR